jgi:DNA-binding transcriptional ArsR family regulator
VFEMRGPAVRTDLDQTLTALADPTRRAIVELLRERPLRPSEVADVLDISRPAMSRHLRVLRMSHLVEEEMIEDDARSRLLQLRRKPFKQLRDWIDEIESFWADQLEAFKAHAERVPKKRRI